MSYRALTLIALFPTIIYGESLSQSSNQDKSERVSSTTQSTGISHFFSSISGLEGGQLSETVVLIALTSTESNSREVYTTSYTTWVSVSANSMSSENGAADLYLEANAVGALALCAGALLMFQSGSFSGSFSDCAPIDSSWIGLKEL